MSHVDQWNADMDAWGLTGEERTHHLWRLHAYHRGIEDLHWHRRTRTSAAEVWLAVVVVVAVLAGIVAGAW